MKIASERLRRLRKDKGLSCARLADQARISERTIRRLENESEQGKSTHERTVRCLAKALRVDEGVLTGELPIRPIKRATGSERVQVGAQIAPKARLAYDLARRRYGITATEIINMAPLFFVLLAEGSLAWRREKLNEAGEAIDRLEQVSWEMGNASFGPGLIRAGDARHLEQTSIDQNDLLGEHLFDGDNANHLIEPFDPSRENPLAGYLRKLANDLDCSGVVGLEQDDLWYGSPPKFPDYDIWREELDAITNGSANAKLALELGAVRLTDIPEHLKGADAGESRAAWLENKLPEPYRKLMEGLASFVATSTDEEKEEVVAELSLAIDQESSAGDNPDREAEGEEDE